MHVRGPAKPAAPGPEAARAPERARAAPGPPMYHDAAGLLLCAKFDPGLLLRAKLKPGLLLRAKFRPGLMLRAARVGDPFGSPTEIPLDLPRSSLWISDRDPFRPPTEIPLDLRRSSFWISDGDPFGPEGALLEGRVGAVSDPEAPP